MLQQERHQSIRSRVERDGRVEVTALSEEFDVTPETVRRDLTVLERHGVLRRVHGGAIAVEDPGREPSNLSKIEQYADEKHRIAVAAKALLPRTGAIMLDAGTSTLALAAMLPPCDGLTVVTNSLPIATTLADRTDIVLYLLGGRLRPRTASIVGSWATDLMGHFAVDVAFLGTNGLTPDKGLTTADVGEAEMKAAMVAAARRVVVLSDHSKFGRDLFARFALLDDVDTVITDTGLDESMAAEVEAAGPQMIRV